MNDQGWVKLHRKLLDWEWFSDIETTHLFIFLLLSANHEDKKWHGIEIKRGEFLTGRKKLAKLTGLSEQKIRYCVNRLKSTSEITTKSTNKYTIISIVKWEQYQEGVKKTTNKTTNKNANEQPASNHYQECKEYKEYISTASAVEEVDWDWEGYLESFTGRRHLEIIRLYWKHKGIKLSNREQAGAEIKRLVKVASGLVGWDDNKIIAVMRELDGMRLSGGWGLEAVARNIARIGAVAVKDDKQAEEFPDWYNERDKEMKRAGYGVRVRKEDGKHVYFL